MKEAAQVGAGVREFVAHTTTGVDVCKDCWEPSQCTVMLEQQQLMLMAHAALWCPQLSTA